MAFTTFTAGTTIKSAEINENFSLKADLASPTFTGTLTADLIIADTISASTIIATSLVTTTLTASSIQTTSITSSSINGTTITGSSIVGTTLTVSNISFPSTQVPSSNANTLDDYEEGTWTPVDSSGAGLSFTSVAASYTKTGRDVVCTFSLAFPATANGSNISIGGLPFASGSYGPNSVQGFFLGTTTITTRGLYGGAGSTAVSVDKNNGTTVAINSDFTSCIVYGRVFFQV